jgi:hypothetical protein
MVKVRNVRGDEYSGTIGKYTTASKWKRVRYLRKWAMPTNPRTPMQMTHRKLFAKAVDMWHTLTPEQKTAYDRMASQYGYSGYNLFVKEYIEMLRARVKYIAPREAKLSVVDSKRKPISCATVEIKKGRRVIYADRTDEEGKFAVTLTVEHEPYDIVVSMPGMENHIALEQSVKDLTKTITLVPIEEALEPCCEK